MFKDFLSWFRLKPKLNNRNHKPPLISEGQIWWCHLGKNIGTEINGKTSGFNRPVIIYKKLSHFTFLVIPTTSQLTDNNGSFKTGSWFVKIKHQSKENLACLHQIRVIDYRRIQNFVTFLTRYDLDKICTGMNKLYFKNPHKINPPTGGDAGKS